MDNLPETLETRRYLDLLSAQLCSLPPDVQTEQREEVCLHLAAMAAACRELGSDADAAEREALARFGDPVQVGKEITRRYWPADILPGTFWSACGTAFFWMTVLHGTAFGLIFFVRNWQISTGVEPSSSLAGNFVLASVALAGAPIMAGVITGWVTPRYAVPAVLLAPLALFGFGIWFRIGDLGFPAIEEFSSMMLGGLSALLVSRRLGRKQFSWLHRLKPKTRVNQ